MIVELDVGNSRIKWRSRSASKVLDEGIAATVTDLARQFDSGQTSDETPKEVLVASVRDDDSLAQISEWARSVWQLTPKLAVVSKQASGVSNSYDDVSRMGIDRWLAMLAAYQRTQSACIVVDSGTALTIDAIGDNGQHLGGYILPGLGLGISAIETNTGIRLQRREVDAADLALGNNTESAVLNGVLAQAIALIERVANQIAVQSQKGPNKNLVHVLLSGGDASTISRVLAGSRSLLLESCPSLVLDGLPLAETRELG